MKVQYQIAEEDYVSAARFHAWRHFITRPSNTSLLASGTIVVLLGVGLWESVVSVEMLVLGIVYVIVLFSVLSALYLFVRVPSQARRHYRQYKAVQVPITAELTDAGIKFSTADSEGILTWSKILQWRQNDRFILTYAMPILYYIVPKTVARKGFDIPLLVQRLAEHVGPER
jgi:hypothetical protein